MRLMLRIFMLAAASLGFVVSEGAAASLEGQPIKVNKLPASGIYTVVSAGAIDLPDGGFGAFWSENVGGADTLADRLQIRFFKPNRKPLGKTVRFDGKVAGRKPKSLIMQSGARLGKEEHILVWQANFGDNDNEYVGQFLDNRVLKGEPVILDNVSAPIVARSPVYLRNGKVLASWYRNTSKSGLQGFGRILTSSSQLGTAGKDLNVHEQFLSSTSSMKVGFIATYRHTVGDQDAIGAQVFKANGGHEGEFIELTKLIDQEEVGFFNVMGLSNGNFVFVHLRPLVPNGDVGDMTAQIYSRGGEKIGPKKKIMKGVPMHGIALTYLPNAHFIMVMEQTAAGGKRRIEYRTFNEALQQVGATAKTAAAVGLVRGGIRLLASNKIASAYRVENQVYLQIVEP